MVLLRGQGDDPGILFVDRLCGGDARTQFNLGPGGAQRQFGHGKGRQAHAFVQIAEVADAEDLARKLRQPRTEGGVVPGKADADDLTRIDAGGVLIAVTVFEASE